MEEAAKTAKQSAESVSRGSEKLGRTAAFKALSQVSGRGSGRAASESRSALSQLSHGQSRLTEGSTVGLSGGPTRRQVLLPSWLSGLR